METTSVHVDKYGTVLKNINDGDNHVYEHDDAKSKADVDKKYSAKNTGAGGKDIGELGGKIDANNIIKNLLTKDIGIAKGIWNPFTFKGLVQDHGAWDFKNNTSTVFGVAEQFMKNGGGETQFQFGKLSMSAEDFGNFHYGVVGDATGLFGEGTLLMQAGRAQISSGTSRPEWQKTTLNTVTDRWGHRDSQRVPAPPYGDDPADQKMIQNGFNYYNSTTGN